jgi:hypothetical protein
VVGLRRRGIGAKEAYNVVETLRGTQTRWAHANDENINVAVVVVLSVYSSRLT